MSQEIMMVRAGSALVPATDHDRAALSQYKQGQAVKVTTTRQSSRSLSHHRLYWGGLIGLMMDYWEPQSGLTNPIEARTAKAFCDYLIHMGINLTPEQSQALQDGYLSDLTKRRAAKMTPPAPATTGEVHQWIKVEAGYFDIIRLPDGSIERKPQSISFASMSQHDFNQFFKAAMGVCWRFVLSRHFESQDDVENAINRMMAMTA